MDMNFNNRDNKSYCIQMQSFLTVKKVAIVTILLVTSILFLNLPLDSFTSSPKQNIRQAKPLQVNIWSTIPRENQYLHHSVQNLPQIDSPSSNAIYQILVDDKVSYQTVDGFGFSLTGGSAMLINKMKDEAKDALLSQLFGKGMNQISISSLRLSMGSSDLDQKTFSYNDLTGNQTDIEQKKFSIDPDRKNLIPILKKILVINPNITIISTPWSPPAWMKDNNKTKGGSLKPEYYDSYAKYFVKYVQEMGKQGIKISAITPQNEPLHPGNNPSMYFTAGAQRDFIKKYLGPAFAAANITTKIIVYDHNLDRPDYPSTIYDDAEAAKYVDGAAFHMYAGNESVMGDLHNKYPNKNLYFTEQWTSSEGNFNGDMEWHTKNVIIGTMRNWAKTAFQWNLANDPAMNPHTEGGCTMCKGAVTIGYNFTLESRNVAYYIIAHASKFVVPGSVRVQSNIAGPIVNVVFVMPDALRTHYMIVFNDSDQPQTFVLLIKGSSYQYQMKAKQISTIGF